MAETLTQSAVPARFRIMEDDLSGPQTLDLLTLHLEGMQANSPPGTVFALDLSGLDTQDVTVWSAWHDDRIASIGALKMLDNGLAELKSMRTHPAFTRQGAAAAILEHIIAVARVRGVRRLSLETGRSAGFEPALALYRRRGFQDGASFADYGDNGFSVFLHLDLKAENAQR